MSALAGKRIVVTRAPHQAGELSDLLRERGAIPLMYPCIDIAPPDDPAPLQNALRALAGGGFDWLILTSVNTVLALRNQLESSAITPAQANRVKVAALGSGTAEAAETLLGLEVDFLPETFTGEALAESLPLERGARVLLPQSALADSTTADSLSERGAVVTHVQAYQTGIGRGGVDLPRLLRAGEVDAITFTSASTVTNLLARLGAEGGKRFSLESVCLACIGAKTAVTARQHDLQVALVPKEHTVAGLVGALEQYFTEQKTGDSSHAV